MCSAFYFLHVHFLFIFSFSLHLVAFIYNCILSVALFSPIFPLFQFSGPAIFALYPSPPLLSVSKNVSIHEIWLSLWLEWPRLTVASSNRKMILTVGAGPSWAPPFGQCWDSSCCCCGSCCLHGPCDPRADSLARRPSHFTRGRQTCQPHHQGHGRRRDNSRGDFFHCHFRFFSNAKGCSFTSSSTLSKVEMHQSCSAALVSIVSSNNGARVRANQTL